MSCLGGVLGSIFEGTGPKVTDPKLVVFLVFFLS